MTKAQKKERKRLRREVIKAAIEWRDAGSNAREEELCESVDALTDFEIVRLTGTSLEA